jgi:DNA topoisomerase-2
MSTALRRRAAARTSRTSPTSLRSACCARSRSRHRDLQPRLANVRGALALFISCSIDNPAFDSQTKETLTTRVVDFGAPFVLSERMAQRIVEESGIVEAVVRQLELRQLRRVDAATAGKKSARGALLGLPKLQDAHYAGTDKANECCLILTEGDSAKALAVAGLSELGRDRFGVYPLRGKLLNVRDAPTQRVLDNAELSAVKTILGLKVSDRRARCSSRRPPKCATAA